MKDAYFLDDKRQLKYLDKTGRGHGNACLQYLVHESHSLNIVIRTSYGNTSHGMALKDAPLTTQKSTRVNQLQVEVMKVFFFLAVHFSASSCFAKAIT